MSLTFQYGKSHSQRIKYVEYLFQPEMCSCDKHIFYILQQNELQWDCMVQYGNNVFIPNILFNNINNTQGCYKIDCVFLFSKEKTRLL